MVQATSLFLLAGAAVGAQACIGPAVNAATINLVSSFEGFRASPYLDPTGHPTIGYGHLCKDKSCSDVKYKIPLSEADGKKLLGQDMAVAQNCITTDTADPVTLNANEYGALCSWAFNVGCGNVASSTLIARLNKGENAKTVIDSELPKWDISSGEVLPGLVRRRKAEVALANTATTAKALPAKC